jgi:DNA-binding MurR/RpiR family transcriptional regulator
VRSDRGANKATDRTVSYALERISTIKGGLTTSEQRVAQAILDKPYELLEWSAADLARESATSAATAVRTCRRLGFSGLNDLRLTLARDLGWPASAARAARPSRSNSLLRDLFGDASRSFETMVTRGTDEAFKRATDYLAHAARVLVVSAGPSTVFAQDFVYNACLAGMEAEFWPDVIMQALAASKLTRRDVCVAISASGVNGLTVQAAESALVQKAKLVAVTGYHLSRLAELATVAVVADNLDYSTKSQAAVNSAGLLLMLRALVIASVNRSIEKGGGSASYLNDSRQVLGRFAYRQPGSP